MSARLVAHFNHHVVKLSTKLSRQPHHGLADKSIEALSPHVDFRTRFPVNAPARTVGVT